MMLRVTIGNHMISSAIWDKSARVNFSKANQIARARRARAICMCIINLDKRFLFFSQLY